MSQTVADEDVDAPEFEPAPGGRGLRITLITIMVVAGVVIAGTVGWLVHGNSASSDSVSVPSSSSVDAGFARDMSTHHTQAVTMAGYERDNTTNASLKLLAYDIETSQQFQLGQMQGWLDAWGLSRNSPHPMSWMGSMHMSMQSNGLMPGMASPAQLATLESAHGKALDILFLQLMIRHHQGGLPMAQYAEQHASESYVRTFAGHMVAAQSQEIVEMEQLLRQLGGSPLAPPAQ